RIAHVAYAVYAENAKTLAGQPATAFAAATHTHDGSAITTGTVAAARIDAAIARDSEITPPMLAHDGAGSRLDADLLDWKDSSAFAAAAHTHDAGDIASGTLSTDRYSAYADLVAEGKIGTGSDQVAAGNHTHPWVPTQCAFQFVTFKSSAGTAPIAFGFIN